MTKWFEEVANDASNIVSSRVRLSRNWEEYKFPSRLEPDEARTMIARLKQNFRDLGDRDGQFYEYEDLELMEKLDRTALRERRLLNRTLAEKTTPGGILCSEDERVSMVLNADDHIRLQVLASGLDLQECYAKADALDDYINEKIPYAFNEKYGYLTSYPTNVGTAMKACQFFGDGTAIYGNERFIVPLAELVDAVCYIFLSRSARTIDKNGHISRSYQTYIIIKLFGGVTLSFQIRVLPFVRSF